MDIDKIMGKKAGISDETKIIILNSIFEAARLGESGKSFAALASEIIEQDEKKQDGT